MELLKSRHKTSYKLFRDVIILLYLYLHFQSHQSHAPDTEYDALFLCSNCCREADTDNVTLSSEEIV